MRVLSAPYVKATASDAPRRAVPFALTVALPLAALGVVVVGFVLVALSLVGVASVSAGWGAGLCVGGWALAAVGRERALAPAPKADASPDA